MMEASSKKRPAPSSPAEITETAHRRINAIKPKTVNSKSRNRRKRQINQDPARDSTPERGNRLQYNHAMKTRLTLKLTLPHHEKMIVPLKSALT